MKKLSLSVIFLLFIGRAWAQSIKFDVVAGYNLSTYAEKEGPVAKGIPNYLQSTTDSYVSGFHAGILAKYSFGNFDVQSGVLYTQKGGDDVVTTQMPNLSPPLYYREYGHRTLNYLEIPLDVIYNFPAKMHRFFLGAGLYQDLGVAGHYNSTYTDVEPIGMFTGSRAYNLGFGGDITNPAYGINVSAGFRFDDGLSFKAGFALDITNLSNNGDFIAHNKSVSFSASYPIFQVKLRHRRMV